MISVKTVLTPNGVVMGSLDTEAPSIINGGDQDDDDDNDDDDSVGSEDEDGGDPLLAPTVCLDVQLSDEALRLVDVRALFKDWAVKQGWVCCDHKETPGWLA